MTKQSSIKIVALTEPGHELAIRLQSSIAGSDILFKPRPFAQKIQQAFSQGHRLIMICATGIAVRCLATVLQDKYNDPAVLVLDEQGKFVIPLLSGHEGGANNWALEIANLLSGQLVMTTAKPYLKPIYTLGMGCERNCPLPFLEEVLEDCLAKANLHISDIHSINSIDIKADEIALIEISKNLNKPFYTWSKQKLSAMENRLSTKSQYVFDTVGVYGVAESAALFAAQDQSQDVSELLVNKIKNTKATCALARSFPLDSV